MNLWASLSPRVQEAGSGLFKVEIDKCFKDGGCEGLGELVHKGIDQPDHIERWGRLDGSGGQNLLLISSVNRKGSSSGITGSPLKGQPRLCSGHSQALNPQPSESKAAEEPIEPREMLGYWEILLLFNRRVKYASEKFNAHRHGHSQ